MSVLVPPATHTPLRKTHLRAYSAFGIQREPKPRIPCIIRMRRTVEPTHTLYFDKMPMNDDHNGSVLLDQGEQPVADLATKLEPPPPPPLRRPTYYRLLVVTTAGVWAIPKAFLSFKNGSIKPTTLDLLSTLFGVVLYWVGLHEARRREGWDWFFKDEVAPTFAMYFFSRAQWALSFLCDMLVLHPFISLFLIGACMLLARYLPNWGTAIISISLTVPVVIIFMSLLVRSTSRRTQLHTH